MLGQVPLGRWVLVKATVEFQRCLNKQIQSQDFHGVLKALVPLVKHLHKSYFIIIKEMHDLILKQFH